MDFHFNQEQILLKNMAADFAAHMLEPNAATWDATNFFPKEALREAAKLGMAGMVAHERMGGSALKRLYLSNSLRHV